MATTNAAILHAGVIACSPDPSAQNDSASSPPTKPPPQTAQPVAPTGSSTQTNGTTVSNSSPSSTAGQDGQGHLGTSNTATQFSTVTISHGHAQSGQFFRTATFGNVLGAAVLVLTVIGLGWGFGVGAVGLDLQKWAARNDALQSCMSWESTGHYSDYCNETIKAGVTRPPLVRRTPAHVSSWLFPDGSTISAYQLALLITVTLCVGVCTLVTFRPRMHSFRPIISSVRTHLPQKVPTWKVLTGNAAPMTIKSIQDIEDAIRDLSTLYWPGSDNPGHILETNDLGRQIGVFYESEGDSDGGSDGDSDTGNDEYDVRFIRDPSFPSATETVPWSIAAEERRPTDVDSIIIAELQEQQAYLMDWPWDEDPDDDTLRYDSDLEASKLRDLTLDELCAASTEVCRAIEMLQVDSEGLVDPQLHISQDDVRVSTGRQLLRRSYVWAIIREISRRAGTRDCTILTFRETGTECCGCGCQRLGISVREDVRCKSVDELRKSWHESVDRLKTLEYKNSRSGQETLHEDIWGAVRKSIEFTRSREDTCLKPQDVLTICPIMTSVNTTPDLPADLSELHGEREVLACVLLWLLHLEQKANNDLYEQRRSTNFDRLWYDWLVSVAHLRWWFGEAQAHPGWASAQRPWLAIERVIQFSHYLDGDYLRGGDVPTLRSILRDISLPKQLQAKLSQSARKRDLLPCLVPWLVTLEKQARDDLDEVITRLESEQRNSAVNGYAEQADHLELLDDKPVNPNNGIDDSGFDIENPSDTGNYNAQQTVTPEHQKSQPLSDGVEIGHPRVDIYKPLKKAARPLDSFTRFFRRAKPKMERAREPEVTGDPWINPQTPWQIYGTVQYPAELEGMPRIPIFPLLELPNFPWIYPQVPGQEYGTDLYPAELEANPVAHLVDPPVSDMLQSHDRRK